VQNTLLNYNFGCSISDKRKTKKQYRCCHNKTNGLIHAIDSADKWILHHLFILSLYSWHHSITLQFKLLKQNFDSAWCSYTRLPINLWLILVAVQFANLVFLRFYIWSQNIPFHHALCGKYLLLNLPLRKYSIRKLNWS